MQLLDRFITKKKSDELIEKIAALGAPSSIPSLKRNLWSEGRKSLGHNPTLLGLFFSILNQFSNTSSFVADGELITLNNSDSNFELEGHNIPTKLFCGFVNWFGHIISDVSGSSTSKGRGMGIPSPIWAWTNDIIAIKRKLDSCGCARPDCP